MCAASSMLEVGDEIEKTTPMTDDERVIWDDVDPRYITPSCFLTKRTSIEAQKWGKVQLPNLILACHRAPNTVHDGGTILSS